jgi:hypothetical protein
MTQTQAERIANVILGVAAIGAAVYVMRNPALRLTVWRALRNATASAGPWLAAEARHAWAESRPAPQRFAPRPDDLPHRI